MQHVEDLTDRIRKVIEVDRDVLLAYLFGSQSEGRAREDSDVDIGILHCGDALIKISKVQEKVAKELGLNEDRIDVVDISKAPLFLKISIVKGSKLVDRGTYERRLTKELTNKFAAVRVMKDSSIIIDSSIMDFLYSSLERIREEKVYLKERILTEEVETVVKDGTLRRAMARSVQVLVEMLLDTCRYLVSVKALGDAEANLDSLYLLSRHNLIPLSLAETLEEAARLRNPLIPGQVEIDHCKLFSEAHEIVEYITPKFEEWILGLLG